MPEIAYYAVAVAGLAYAALLVLLVLLLRARSSATASDKKYLLLEEKYKPIIDIDDAITAAKKNLSEITEQLTAERQRVESATSELRGNYLEKKQVYDQLNREISALEDRIEYAELGIYKPKPQYDDSARYATELAQNSENQKSLISSNSAVFCATTWHVDGSVSKGRTMTNRAIKMTLRAFNNECAVIISKVSWKNFSQMSERIKKSRTALNKLNESNAVFISDTFLELKLTELKLTHEERVRKIEEQERLREEREREREEAKAQRELEVELRRAEKKEEERREALMEARAELRVAQESEKESLNARIAELEARLAAAHTATERAMSMAQQTRVGYVYVISNIGSFGDGVFKIGMTRRLEPLDRIRELGDASVPFPFDVHALIFTDDAPALERSLQTELEHRRVNMVNPRKEFFRVKLEELKEKVTARFPNSTFLDKPEAEQYLQSLSVDQIAELTQSEESDKFPSTI